MMTSATSDVVFLSNKYLSNFFFQFQMEKNSTNYFCEQVIQIQF